MNVNSLQAMKMNLIWIVNHHKKTCDGKDCNISLIYLRLLAEKAGLKFTKKEEMMFL